MAFPNLVLLATALVTFFLINSSSASGTKYLSAGESCHPNSYKKCGTGLRCEGEVCKILDSGDCTGMPDLCVSGKSCVGKHSTKKCKTLMGPGGQCETDPFWFCQEGLECENKVCKIPKNGECIDNPDECVDGLTCVGTNRRKLCKVLRKVDETCGQDPFWVCEDGLVCEDTCKIKKDGVCTSSPMSCAMGLECLGSGSEKRCVTPVSVGEVCEKTSFDICEGGLVCEDNECKIPEGGACQDAPDGSCVSGTSCIPVMGGSGKVCGVPKPVPVGEACEVTGLDMCDEGLVCEENVCKIPDRGECTDNPMECAMGLSCVGTDKRKKCKVLRKVDETCGQDPFWVCEDGLVCEGTCKIKKDGVCTSSPMSCAKDLECLGLRSEKRCVNRIAVGDVCETDDFNICQPGLVCEEKECKIPEGEPCDKAPADSCVSGTTCIPAMGGSGKVCGMQKPVPAGGACEVTGFDMCDKGLKCEKNVCKIKFGGICTNNPHDCQRRTICVGTDKKKKCKRPMGLGKSCKDPFWVCHSSLVCDKHDLICKIPRGSACKRRTARLCVSGTKCVGYRRKKCH